MGTLNPPATVAQFEQFFTRDFKYGPGIDSVRPVDIQNSLNTAASTYNPSLFSTALIGIPPNQISEAITAYLYCAAHYLVTSIQGVGGLGKVGGGMNSQGEGIITSKGVGGVNVSFSWPQSVTNSPVLSQFSKTVYGNLYLQMLMPKLVGNVSAVIGETAGDQGFGGDFPVTGFLGPF